jgi:hypothetical protein
VWNTLRRIGVHGQAAQLKNCRYALWKNPKISGIVFGSELVLLISLASLSLLTVVGSLMLLALTAVGAYRFYLALMFRIKGTPDQTFE